MTNINTISLTVPAILTNADIASDLGTARMALESASLAFVVQARLTAEELYTAARDLDWDNADDVAALTARRDATRAYHTLDYAHQQLFGNGGYPASVRPAWLPALPAVPEVEMDTQMPLTGSPITDEETYPGEADDRL